MPRRRDDPRYLVFRHARRYQKVQAGALNGLQPGEQQLHAFLMPGLPGGSHTVTVDQEVEANSTVRHLTASQKFYVHSPEFQLPEGEVNSVYPPAGHEERAECLPHVVLNTPTLPWEWKASSINDTPDYQNNRNRVPWLAVLVFTKNELQLGAPDLQGDHSLFRNINGPETSVTQTQDLAVSMKVADISKLDATASPIKVPPLDPDVSTNVIFLKNPLFKELFAADDPQGESMTAAHPNVRPYRFLAHRRVINTDGMAVAALAADDNDQASFGVVFSHRTGPVDITEPTACIAHLVSIRGIEGMAWPDSSVRYVALSSLHSWTYTCLPPDTPSVFDQFKALGRSSAMLQSPVTRDDLKDSSVPEKLKDRVGQRLSDGYTLARYRTQTGESTACFFRGPFMPVQTLPAGTRSWHFLSNSGQDLQILDQELGLLDITYSAAWQLGRTLAIADQEFITRIGLVRKHIFDRGMELCQLQVLAPHGTRSRSQLLAELPKMVSKLHSLPGVSRSTTASGHAHARRWFRSPVEPVDLSYRSRRAAPMAANEKSMRDYFINAAMEISSASNADGSPSDVPYNEHNIPYSADWMAVLKWVLNRLYLSTIPPYYLVPDSSQLSPESVRFFRIDWRWMDALVDGALSLANYRDQEDDLVRDAIWAAIQRYRTTKVPELGDMLPPIPEYGCYIRSTLVTKFPDLRVELNPPQGPNQPLILLRHEIVSPDTMLCLFSQEPGPPSFKELSFVQPPHQQTFVAASKLNQTTISMAYKRAYTVPITNPNPDPIATKEWTRPQAACVVPVYRWDAAGVEVRRVLMENLAADYLDTVQKEMPEDQFQDDTATSTLLASQLGSVSYKLTFSLPDGLAPTTAVLSTVQHPHHHSHIPPVPNFIPPQPAYHYRVCPVDQPKKPQIPMLPIEQDLLFLINLEPYTEGSYYLEEIRITIPLGDPQYRKPTLMKNYSGSGAEMITNPRFNVMVDITSKDGHATSIVLRLVPRARSKDAKPARVSLRSCRELSFTLDSVAVIQYTEPTRVKMTVMEKYTGKSARKPYDKVDDIELVLQPTKNE